MGIIAEDHEYKLNEEQDMFCRLYAYGSNRGNGVQCYAEAYSIDLSERGAYNSARANSSRLLTNDNILSYIRSLYEESDLSHTVVDNELAFVIKQNADFRSKVAAIKEYNQLSGRIVKKLELSGAIESPVSDDQFNQLLAAAREGAKTNTSE